MVRQDEHGGRGAGTGLPAAPPPPPPPQGVGGYLLSDRAILFVIGMGLIGALLAVTLAVASEGK